MDNTDLPTLSDDQRRQLLEAQFQTAMAGSEALQIHLGKAYLGQHDRHQIAVEQLPMGEKTYEQLLDALEQRQLALKDEKLLEGLAITVASADR